jgi:hypothetical protein
MRIQELQEKEANSRQQLNLAVDEKIRSLRSIQIDEGLGFDSEIRAIERERKYQPFTKTGDGAQELFDIETETKLLAKRREKFNAESIKETQIQGAQLFKDTSVQDALINSNDKLIIAIDELRATLVEQANADVFAAAAEQEKLKGKGSSFGQEISSRESKVAKLKNELSRTEYDLEQQYLKGATKRVSVNAKQPGLSPGYSQADPLFLAKFQPKGASKQFKDIDRAATAELEKTKVELKNELSSLTSEINSLTKKQDLINSNKSLLLDPNKPSEQKAKPGDAARAYLNMLTGGNAAPYNSLAQSAATTKNFNLNKIFNDAQSQFSNVKDPAKFNESMKNEMLKVITKDAGFQEALGKRKDLQGAKIKIKLKLYLKTVLSLKLAKPQILY